MALDLFLLVFLFMADGEIIAVEQILPCGEFMRKINFFKS